LESVTDLAVPYSLALFSAGMETFPYQLQESYVQEKKLSTEYSLVPRRDATGAGRTQHS
jgi:hypothetical protein